MDATVKNIKLVKSDNGYAWNIVLLDRDGTLRTLNSSSMSDNDNFRKFTFGLLYTLNTDDFLEFLEDLEIPIMYEATFTGIKTIANDKGDYIAIKNGSLETGKEIDSSNMQKGKVKSIKMQSGSILVNIAQNFGSQNFGGLNLLSGLGYPLDTGYYIGTESNLKQVSQDFRTFVEGILKVCNIDDLLEKCPPEKLPKISLLLNEQGEISAIGNVQKDFWINFNGNDVILSSKPLVVSSNDYSFSFNGYSNAPNPNNYFYSPGDLDYPSDSKSNSKNFFHIPTGNDLKIKNNSKRR